MTLSLKNMGLGFVVAGFMFVALFFFASSWSAMQGVSMSGSINDINSNINTTMNTMYAQSEEDQSIMEKSDIYTGSDIGLISSDAYRAVKNTFKMTSVAFNTTSQLSRLGLVPDFVWTMLITVLMITITFLVIAAVFRTG